MTLAPVDCDYLFVFNGVLIYLTENEAEDGAAPAVSGTELVEAPFRFDSFQEVSLYFAVGSSNTPYRSLLFRFKNGYPRFFFFLIFRYKKLAFELIHHLVHLESPFPFHLSRSNLKILSVLP